MGRAECDARWRHGHQNMTIAAVDAVADPHTGSPLPQLVQNLTTSSSSAAAAKSRSRSSPGLRRRPLRRAPLGPIRPFAAAGAAATTIDCSGSGGTVLHFDPPSVGRRRLFSAGADDGATHVEGLTLSGGTASGCRPRRRARVADGLRDQGQLGGRTRWRHSRWRCDGLRGGADLAVLRNCVVEGNSVDHAPAGMFGSTQVGGGGMFVGDLGGGNVTLEGSVRGNAVTISDGGFGFAGGGGVLAGGPLLATATTFDSNRVVVTGSYTEDDSSTSAAARWSPISVVSRAAPASMEGRTAPTARSPTTSWCRIRPLMAGAATRPSPVEAA